MSEIKPIQTRYKGYNFRSRLEARWAVFFDSLGVDWVYEPEGYQTPYGGYLPDFYLPKTGGIVEIKGVKTDETGWNKSVYLDTHLPDGVKGVTTCVGDPLSNISTLAAFCVIVCGCEDNFNHSQAAYDARSARFEHGQNGAT